MSIQELKVAPPRDFVSYYRKQMFHESSKTWVKMIDWVYYRL